MTPIELIMILWVIMGIITAYLAYQKGRDPYIWFAIGIFFGILAMLAIVFLPPAESEEELEIVKRREKQVEEEEKLENAQDMQPQSIETKEWFYLDKAGHQQGPLSFYSVNETWENGDINSHSYVWTEGMADWKHIHDMPDLHQLLEKLEEESRKTFPQDL